MRIPVLSAENAIGKAYGVYGTGGSHGTVGPADASPAGTEITVMGEVYHAGPLVTRQIVNGAGKGRCLDHQKVCHTPPDESGEIDYTDPRRRQSV